MRYAARGAAVSPQRALDGRGASRAMHSSDLHLCQDEVKVSPVSWGGYGQQVVRGPEQHHCPCGARNRRRRRGWPLGALARVCRPRHQLHCLLIIESIGRGTALEE